MNYCKRIRALRLESGLSQQKIADYLGVAQRTYSDYESGDTRLPIGQLIALARYYDVSMNYISGASNQRTAFPSL